MGWIIYSEREPVTDPQSELDGLVNGPALQVLESAIVGSTYYAAVEHSEPGRDPCTFAAVYLFQRRPFGFKSMDESVGPNEARCPAAILDRLTPLGDPTGRDKWAAAWRERARANLAVAAQNAGKTNSRSWGAVVPR